MSDLPPPPPPPPPHAGYGQTRYAYKAGAWIRLVARLIDGLLLVIPNLVVVWAIGDGDVTRFDTGGRAWVASLISTLVGLAYYVLLESSRGQTVGKMALSLHVQGPHGGYPTPSEAFRRNSWTLLGLIPIVGGFATLGIMIAIGVTISNDPYGRGIHDNLADGTIVQRGA